MTESDENIFWDNLSKKPDPNYKSVNLIQADSVEPEPIKWLWDGYLARGKFHVLAGAPGTGKTTLAIKLAALVSSGGTFPDGTKCEDQGVIIWSGEDDMKDTLIPRLIASGAYLENIFFVNDVIQNGKERSFDPATDIRELWVAGMKLPVHKVGLVIIDPVANVVAGDSHKNGEVRRSLAPLVDMFQRLGCAGLCISHFSKGTAGRDPLERVTGSLAFGALARIVLVTAKVTTNGIDRRIFCRAKSNIGLDDGGFEYEIKETELESHKGVFTSFAKFGTALDGNATELLSEHNADDSGSDCGDFLTALLKGNKMAAKDVLSKGIENGFSDKQIRAAGKKLKVRIQREGFSIGSVVYWSLVNMDGILSHSLQKK